MENYYNNFDLIKLLIKWKIHLVIIVIISVILAIIFSSPWFITPKYKSSAIVYPANISPYSEETETEQMLQLLQSMDIKDSIIKKFDLPKHYKIDSSYKYFYSTLIYEYGQNVIINKTPYESVEIEVLDKDPRIACDMVNSIIDFYNIMVRKMHNDKYTEVIKMFKSQLINKRKRIDSLEVMLKDLSTKYGLIEYGSQSLEVTKGLLKTVYGSNAASINTKEVLKLKNNLQEKGGGLITLTEMLVNENKEFSILNVEYEQVLRFYTDELTYANVVSKPFPSDKKAYPIRWLIVVLSAMVTLFLSIVVILIIENYKSFIKQ
jgi:capsular polysaccharide biosynthesis protein